MANFQIRIDNYYCIFNGDNERFLDLPDDLFYRLAIKFFALRKHNDIDVVRLSSEQKLGS